MARAIKITDSRTGVAIYMKVDAIESLHHMRDTDEVVIYRASGISHFVYADLDDLADLIWGTPGRPNPERPKGDRRNEDRWRVVGKDQVGGPP